MFIHVSTIDSEFFLSKTVFFRKIQPKRVHQFCDQFFCSLCTKKSNCCMKISSKFFFHENTSWMEFQFYVVKLETKESYYHFWTKFSNTCQCALWELWKSCIFLAKCLWVMMVFAPVKFSCLSVISFCRADGRSKNCVGEGHSVLDWS